MTPRIVLAFIVFSVLNLPRCYCQGQGSCSYNSKTYSHNAIFSAIDGCDGCICKNEKVWCDKKFCNKLICNGDPGSLIETLTPRSISCFTGWLEIKSAFYLTTNSNGEIEFESDCKINITQTVQKYCGEHQRTKSCYIVNNDSWLKRVEEEGRTIPCQDKKRCIDLQWGCNANQLKAIGLCRKMLSDDENKYQEYSLFGDHFRMITKSCPPNWKFIKELCACARRPGTPSFRSALGKSGTGRNDLDSQLCLVALVVSMVSGCFRM